MNTFVVSPANHHLETLVSNYIFAKLHFAYTLYSQMLKFLKKDVKRATVALNWILTQCYMSLSVHRRSVTPNATRYGACIAVNYDIDNI